MPFSPWGLYYRQPRAWLSARWWPLSTLLSLLISWRYVPSGAGTPVGEYAAILDGSHGGSDAALQRHRFGQSIFVAHWKPCRSSSYLLSGYMKRDARSSEAALKYLLVGSAAAAVFLYGTSLLYGVSERLHQPRCHRSSALQGSGVTPSEPLWLWFLSWPRWPSKSRRCPSTNGPRMSTRAHPRQWWPSSRWAQKPQVSR